MRVVVTLTAMGSPGAGDYNWIFGDGDTTSGPNLISVTHPYSFPESYTVQVIYTPSKAGCQASTANKLLDVPKCPEVKPPPDNPPPPDKPPNGGKNGEKDDDKKDDEEKDDEKKKNGGGSFGCDGLLVAAIAIALLGALAVLIAFCSTPKIMLAIAVGIAVTALGLGLLLLWNFLCGETTSCDVMRDVHCGLFLMVFITPVAVIVVGLLTKSLECAGAVGVFWGFVGSLYASLGFAMTNLSCPKRCG
jgi:hypothetical protein